MHPGMFRYVFEKDRGVTGNLEVTIKKAGGSKQAMAHSKRNGQGYPHSNWEGFHSRLDAAIKNC